MHPVNRGPGFVVAVVLQTEETLHSSGQRNLPSMQYQLYILVTDAG